MRRVLAGLSMAALAFLVVAPASAAGQADPGVEPAIFGQPVINEVATRGPAGSLDQMVEIANPSRTQAADLSGWQVRVFSSTDVLLQVIIIPQGTVLQPLGAAALEDTYWTLSSPAFTGGPVDQPGAIVADIPDNGGVALFNAIGMKLDGVAFSPGAVTAVEGTPLTPQPTFLDLLGPAHGRDIISADTNNNNVDFKLLVRSEESPN